MYGVDERQAGGGQVGDGVDNEVQVRITGVGCPQVVVKV
jgi:hypothetical protein